MKNPIQHTIDTLEAQPNIIIGALKDYKLNKERGNDKGRYKVARTLSNIFRDATSRKHFRCDLRYNDQKYIKKNCLWEHCLGLQSVAYKFLEIYYNDSDNVTTDVIIDFLTDYAFQICIPEEFKSKIIDGKTINKALEEFQNEHLDVFITFKEYVRILTKYGLILDEESRNALKQLFNKVEAKVCELEFSEN